jgi:hypothetical protein
MVIMLCWKGLKLVDSNDYVVEENVGVWLEIKNQVRRGYLSGTFFERVDSV